MPVNQEELRAELIALLESHDWTYQYSDDYSVWSQGAAQRRKIEALVKLLPEEGTVLFQQYMPKRMGN